MCKNVPPNKSNKILHNFYDKDVTCDIFHISRNTTTRGHSLKLSTQPSRLDIWKYSFAVRVIRPWNSLPENVVTAPSVQTFESRLDKAWNDQPINFNYKEELRL